MDVVVAPPFTGAACGGGGARGNSQIGVAAQNIHWEREGAFTGEVSAAMVRDAGAAYVIVGHSERRTLFGETDETVNRKARAAIAARLTPIVCIGETLRGARGATRRWRCSIGRSRTGSTASPASSWRRW